MKFKPLATRRRKLLDMSEVETVLRDELRTRVAPLYGSRLPPLRRARPAPVITVDRVWGNTQHYEKRLILCDLDGTLADNSSRRGLIPVVVQGATVKDWEPFNRACVSDEVIHTTAQLVSLLISSQVDIVFVTGRSNGTRESTLQWLRKTLAEQYPQLWRYDVPDNFQLYMRPDDDHRSAGLVKTDLFKTVMTVMGYKQEQVIIVDDDPFVFEEAIKQLPRATYIRVPTQCAAVTLQCGGNK